MARMNDYSTDQANPSRRSFLGGALTSGLLASSGAYAESAPMTTKPLRIGALAVGEFSFWPYSWADLMHPELDEPFRGSLKTDLLNMKVTHVWDVNAKEAQSFADRVGAKTVNRYDGMVGEVDAVAFGGFYEVPWQHILARPYIEAGIPVFLCRPFAYSLRDIDTILDLAAKHNTPVIATDVYEHLYDISSFKRQAEAIAPLDCVQGTSLGSDYAALFHIKFMIPRIFGYDVESVALVTDNPHTSSYLTETYVYRETQDRPSFTCTMTLTSQDLYYLFAAGKGGVTTSRLPQIPEWEDDVLVHHVPQLVDMQRTFMGTSHEPLDIIRKKTELFLTGFYSAVERKGAPVTVGELPVDWSAPYPKPGWITSDMLR